MKTYLVTGGAGFIGSNYIHYLFEKYKNTIRIINLDCLTYAGNLENLEEISKNPGYEFVLGDIKDAAVVHKIFNDNDIDYVVHFAAESHVDRSIENPENFLTTNVLGTFVLLEAARKSWEKEEGTYPGNKRFLHVSTDEVYGSLDDLDSFFYETTPLDPRSPYSASKAASDMFVNSYIHTYKFPAIITNCSNNYGPRQYPEKLIPLTIRKVLLGEKIPVYGDGKNIRDWLYVKDHVKGIESALTTGDVGERYNIGGHNEKENIEVVSIILSALQKRKKGISMDLVEYVKDRKGHDRRYGIAPDKIKAKTGWVPETPFEKGIEMTIDWYLEDVKRLNIQEGEGL